MTYATRTDLEARYGTAEVAQRESMLAAGSVVQALTDADSLINGYLAGRYTVPLSPVPTNVPRIACQLARYLLLGNAADDRARQDYEDAMTWLRDVASGKVILVDAVKATTTAVSAKPVVRTGTRQFDADGLSSY